MEVVVKALFYQLLKHGVLLCFGLASVFCAQAGVIVNVSRVAYSGKTIYIFGENHADTNDQKTMDNVAKVISKQNPAVKSFFKKLNKKYIVLLIECSENIQKGLRSQSLKVDYTEDYFKKFYKGLAIGGSLSLSGDDISFIDNNVEIINFDKTRPGIARLKYELDSIFDALQVLKTEEKAQQYLNGLKDEEAITVSWDLSKLENYITKNKSCAINIDCNIFDHISNLKEHIGEGCSYGEYDTVVSFFVKKYNENKKNIEYFKKFFDYVRKIERVVADIDLLQEIENMDQGDIVVVHCGDYHRESVVQYLKNHKNAKVETIDGNLGSLKNDLLSLLPTVNNQQEDSNNNNSTTNYDQQVVKKKNNQIQTSASWYTKFTNHIGYYKLPILVAGGIGAALYCYFLYPNLIPKRLGF